ncbi:hypothetical protein B0H21DRAFT_894972 [Amylocystis lapponica]|nr:hypothetical protein B0H21DRAFT_894972 [Amylocystis lapponica]
MPDVIDLTNSEAEAGSDAEGSDFGSDSDSISSSGEEEVPPLDEAARVQLRRALATIPEERLRMVVAELVLTNPEVEIAVFKKLVTVKKTGKRKKDAVPRWETCGVCDEEFDAGRRRKADECLYHPGHLKVDYNKWPDWDEDVHGPMDTSANRAEYPENFTWTCCRQDGTVEGCQEAEHVSGGPGKKRARH